ncbi:MAG: hypothetical protein M1826_004155 [Phylliscum demangeonii]|nr:MAG: hypothetical protein M1826_004155 [Phylliscum demangeonii]
MVGLLGPVNGWKRYAAMALPSLNEADPEVKPVTAVSSVDATSVEAGPPLGSSMAEKKGAKRDSTTGNIKRKRSKRLFLPSHGNSRLDKLDESA